MFTGLVETKGSVLRVVKRGRDALLGVRGNFSSEALTLGESIAVDGVCLTVASILEGGPGMCAFEADASSETLDKTTLGELVAGSLVNLERAMPLGGRMGGHIVSGHVDGVGAIVEKMSLGAAVRVTFRLPSALLCYVAPKGSITLSGVSLTVNEVSDDRFSVVLVPHTRDKTSLDALLVGARVNVEVDLLARYVGRLIAYGRDAEARAGGAGEDIDAAHASTSSTSSSRSHGDAAWMERLKRSGYL